MKLGANISLSNDVSDKVVWKKLSPIWLVVVVVFTGFIITYSLYQKIVKQEHTFIKQFVQENLNTVSQLTITRTDDLIAALERMAQRWEIRKGIPRDEWLQDAKNYIRDNPAFTTIEWVDNTFHIKWLEPLQGNENVIGMNIGFNDERKKALEGAAQKGKTTITPPLDLVQGYRALISYIPIYIGSKFDGFIAGLYDLEKLFSNTLSNEIKNNFFIEVYDESKPLLDIEDQDKTYYESWAQTLVVKRYNREWRITLWPKHSFIEKHQSMLSILVLLGGIVFSILVSIAIYYAIISNKISSILRLQSMKLKESQGHLKAILEMAPDGILSVDEKGYIQSVNNTIVQIFGYDEKELLDKPIEILIPKKYHSQHKRDVSKFIKEDNSKRMAAGREVVGIRKNGEDVPLEVGISRSKMPDGSVQVIAAIRDITEIKRIESNLVNTGRILENSLNEVYIYDQKSLKFLHVNRGGRENLGYSTEELLELTPIDIIPKYNFKSFTDFINPLLQNVEKKLVFETQHQRKNKSFYNVEIHLQKSEYQGSEVFVAIVLDITDRKEQEKIRLNLVNELTKSNEFNSAIMSSATHLIIATDPEGVITFFNQASEKALGYKSDEVIRKHSPALWHNTSEIVERAEILSKELGQSVSPGFEVFVIKSRKFGRDSGVWTFKRKDESTFPASLTVTCMRNDDKKIIGYLGVIEDITVRKQSERRTELLKSVAMTANEAHTFDTLLNTALSMICKTINWSIGHAYIWNEEKGKLVSSNNWYLPDKNKKQFFEFVDVTNNTEFDVGEGFPGRVYKTKAPIWIEDISNDTNFPRNKILKNVNVRGGIALPLKLKNNVAAVLEFFDDKSIKIDRDTLAVLEAVVLQLSHFFERKETENSLKQANAELEEFSYRISHDLRSPLISAMKLLELAEKSMSENKKEIVHKSIEHAYKSLGRLEKLVQDILEITKIKNKSEVSRYIDFNILIEDTIEKLSHMDNFNRVDIQKKLGFRESISLKESRIRLIIENLISNAIKYQDINEPSSYMKLSTYEEDKQFILKFEDNGLGIPKEQHKNIFTMFKRFHSRVSFGSGLGLYMMKKSALVLGGDLIFESPDKGVIFKLILPISLNKE